MVARFLAYVVLSLLGVLPLSASALAFTGIYVLGDSLSDQGNLFAATSVLGPPLGQPAIPAADHYFEGRFSNGENYAGVLAAKLGLTLAPSLHGGNNFAFGGTRTNYNVVEEPPFGEGPAPGIYPRSAYPWTLNLQRDAFNARVAMAGADPTALYVVFSGANDVSDILRRRLNPTTTIANAVAGIQNVIEAFKAAGAHTVLVPNLPDLGLVPRILAFEPLVPGISATATALTRQYNTALDFMLRSETGIEIVPFDTFDFFRDVVNHPSAYGFTNASQPCFSGFVSPDPGATVCADPDDYVFWDIEHPSRAFYTVFADRLFSTVTAVPEPAGISLFGLGMAILALASRRRNRS